MSTGCKGCGEYGFEINEDSFCQDCQYENELETELAELKAEKIAHLALIEGQDLQISELRERCESAEKALEIYANDKNWSDRNFLYVNDLELRQHEFNDPCGKKAREHFAKYKGDKK